MNGKKESAVKASKKLTKKQIHKQLYDIMFPDTDKVTSFVDFAKAAEKLGYTYTEIGKWYDGIYFEDFNPKAKAEYDAILKSIVEEEETAQDRLMEAVRNLSLKKYRELCAKFLIDNEDAMEMSDFISNRTDEQAVKILDMINK